MFATFSSKACRTTVGSGSDFEAALASPGRTGNQRKVTSLECRADGPPMHLAVLQLAACTLCTLKLFLWLFFLTPGENKDFNMKLKGSSTSQAQLAGISSYTLNTKVNKVTKGKRPYTDTREQAMSWEDRVFPGKGVGIITPDSTEDCTLAAKPQKAGSITFSFLSGFSSVASLHHHGHGNMSMLSHIHSAQVQELASKSGHCSLRTRSLSEADTHQLEAPLPATIPPPPTKQV